MKLKEIHHLYHSELDIIYEKNEVNSFFYILIDEYLGLSRLELSLNPEFLVEKNIESKLLSALDQLKEEIPIQYILGKTEFYGLNFKVNEHTLIPRPETEELVSWILSQQSQLNVPSLKVLDIGTGSGCIAISLADKLRTAEVSAMDVSKEALLLAAENAKLNEVNVDFLEGDILNPNYGLKEFERMKFDIIVSNPPYVRQQEKSDMSNNVLQNEPHTALFVEDSNPLIFYKAITEFATKYLKENGHLYFEINQYLGQEMNELLEEFHFKDIELKKDIFGNDRMIKGIF